MTTEVGLIILTILGGIAVAYEGFRILSRFFGPLRRFNALLLDFASDYVKVAAFRKKALSYRMEDVLNQSAYPLGHFLPDRWIKRAKIEWVRKSKRSVLRGGDIVLRIAPSKSIEISLMSAMWHYFGTIIFPDNSDILPRKFLSGVSLAIARSSLANTHQHLTCEFDAKFVKEAAENQYLDLGVYADCVRLNEIGLLMGPLVREIDRAAVMLKLEGRTEEIQQTIQSVIDHLLQFQPVVRWELDREDWACHTAHGAYAIMLVSRPPETRAKPQAYVDRAKQALDQGIERIYIVGRMEEKQFFDTVIRQILSLREMKGLDRFKLIRDYRGDPGGICTSVGPDPILKDLSPTPRQIPEIEIVTATVQPATERETTNESVELEQFAKTIAEIIVSLSDYEGEWINLAEIGGLVRERIPDFYPGNFGEKNLYSILKKIDTLSTREQTAPQGKVVFVRAKNGDQSTLIPEIVAILARESNGDWIYGSQVGTMLRKHITNFSPEKFGFSTLGSFIESIEDLEVRRDEIGPVWYVKIKKDTGKKV